MLIISQQGCLVQHSLRTCRLHCRRIEGPQLWTRLACVVNPGATHSDSQLGGATMEGYHHSPPRHCIYQDNSHTALFSSLFLFKSRASQNRYGPVGTVVSSRAVLSRSPSPTLLCIFRQSLSHFTSMSSSLIKWSLIKDLHLLLSCLDKNRKGG